MVSRRLYWSRRMDDALVFLQEALRYPVEECGENLVPLPDATTRAGVEVCYSEKPFPGGMERLFLLRESLISCFVAIAGELNKRDLVLRVEDAYRTPRMQKSLALVPDVLDRVIEMVSWESGQEFPTPEEISDRLKVLVAWYPKTAGHMSGSAVDISVLDKSTLQELDRGGSYMELSENTPMDSPFIDTNCRRNREMISEIFSRHSFFPYPFEFWHYSSGDALSELIAAAGRTARYGPVDFDPSSGNFLPVACPLDALISPEELGFID